MSQSTPRDLGFQDGDWVLNAKAGVLGVVSGRPTPTGRIRVRCVATFHRERWPGPARSLTLTYWPPETWLPIHHRRREGFHAPHNLARLPDHWTPIVLAALVGSPTLVRRVTRWETAL